MQKNNKLTLEAAWPDKPEQFPPVMTPTEAAQFLIEDRPKIALVATEAYKYVRLWENDLQ